MDPDGEVDVPDPEPVCQGFNFCSRIREDENRSVPFDDIPDQTEASGDLRQILEILQNRPADFTVLSGDDWLAFAVVASGGDGLISVTSNEAPGPMTALVDLACTGDLDAARACLYRLLPLMDANFLETNPSPVKAGLALMGRIRDALRLPLVPVGSPPGPRSRSK